MAIVHLILALGLMIISSMKLGTTSICTVLALFCATMNLNYCCVLIYIVYTMFDLLTNIDPIGVIF